MKYVALLAGILCGLLTSCSTTTPALHSTRVSVIQELVPQGQYARRQPQSMSPKYITIHSTQSYGRGANARSHAMGQKNGAFKGPNNKVGYRSWHFTVDDHSIYQSLPATEQGQHADYEGPGNKTSIGIEMCQNSDGNWSKTLDNAARLTADLMRQYNIPISNVVPHMHWRMIRYSDGRDLGYKACPLPLLDHGKLGAKWQSFLRLVESYR